MRLSSFSFSGLLLTGVLLSSIAFTTSAQAEDSGKPSGLPVGENVVPGKNFLLPVVNGWEKERRFGPSKWVGDRAKEEEKKKLVVVSFFATWCEPCKKEMPELVRMYNKYKDQGLGMMLVSIDDRAKSQEVVDLAAKSEVTFPVLHDRYKVVARRWEAERLPYMVMVAPSGDIKIVHVGYTDEVKENLENEIRAELGLEPLKKEVVEDTSKRKKSKKGKKSSKKKSKKYKKKKKSS
ncbi:MAG: TlpA family protein disulfide reductase [Deltaproteobacteria bacterium]|nr:TlpA family protein disulfide reductase [Deltaproteobacteria bacterium]